MSYRRGDIVLVRFPFTTATGTKIRPAVVVQCDRNNLKLYNVIVAAITTTIHRSGERTQFLINVASPIGRQSGLLRDSVVTCENLATVDLDLVLRQIGSLPADAIHEINECLKSALDLP